MLWEVVTLEKATTSETTPENPNVDSNENQQLEGQGIDAKGLGDGITNQFGSWFKL